MWDLCKSRAQICALSFLAAATNACAFSHDQDLVAQDPYSCFGEPKDREETRSECTYADACAVIGRRNAAAIRYACVDGEWVRDEVRRVEVCERDRPPACLSEWTQNDSSVAEAEGHRATLSGDGKTMALASPQGGADGTGEIQIYVANDTQWSLQSSLAKPSRARSFGSSIAISADGNSVAVGDAERSGVSLFLREGDQWSTGEELERPLGAHAFGWRIALSSDGNTLVVAYFVGRQSQAAIYTKKDTGTWSGPTQIAHPTNAKNFGYSIAVSAHGEVVAIGDDAGGINGGGECTTYLRETNWTPLPEITKPEHARAFGGSVALSADGTILMVGDKDGGVDSRGAVSIFQRPENGSPQNAWISKGTLARPREAGEFGISLSLSSDGKRAVIGDNYAEVDMNGAASVYTEIDGIWSVPETLERPASAIDFGHTVAISADGTRLVVGDSHGGEDAGDVTLYSRIAL